MVNTFARQIRKLENANTNGKLRTKQTHTGVWLKINDIRNSRIDVKHEYKKERSEIKLETLRHIDFKWWICQDRP